MLTSPRLTAIWFEIILHNWNLRLEVQKCERLVGWLVLFLAVMCWACKPEKAISPEQAVYLRLRSNEKVVASSIQTVPAAQLRNSYFVFTGYNLRPQNEQAQELGNKCTSLYEVVHTDSGWEVGRQGGTGCSTNPHTDVFGLHIGRGMDYADGNGSFSFAGGETAISDAVWVEVQWDDGTLQTVSVVNEHFIALRDGIYNPVLFTVLDKEGKGIYSYENAP